MKSEEQLQKESHQWRQEFMREVQPLFPPPRKVLFSKTQPCTNSDFSSIFGDQLKHQLMQFGVTAFDAEAVDAAQDSDNLFYIDPNMKILYPLLTLSVQHILNGLKQIANSPTTYFYSCKQQFQPLLMIVSEYEVQTQNTMQFLWRLTDQTGVTCRFTTNDVKKVIVRKNLQMGTDIAVVQLDWLKQLIKQDFIDFSLLFQVVVLEAEKLNQQDLDFCLRLKTKSKAKVAFLASQSNFLIEDYTENRQLKLVNKGQYLKFQVQKCIKLTKDAKLDLLREITLKCDQKLIVMCRTTAAAKFIRDKLIQSHKEIDGQILLQIAEKFDFQIKKNIILQKQILAITDEIVKMDRQQLIDSTDYKLLIVTDETLSGLNLPQFDIAIHYDLPLYEDLIKRFIWSQKQLFFVSDESKINKLLLMKHLYLSGLKCPTFLKEEALIGETLDVAIFE